jgi:phospholipid/cholesterol/gamma-HCH transport system substrate-binding protein
VDATPGGRSSWLLQLRVGAFVVGGLLIFTGLVYFLGRQSGLFERQYRLLAPFAQVGGLIEGATVRLAGVPVGRVTAIRLPETGASKVQVELTLVRRIQERVRGDSVARIETLGLLGDKIIEVSLGTAGAAVLADGAEIKTEEPFDTSRLTRQGNDLLRNLVDVTGELKTTLAQITGSGMGTDLAETAKSVRSLAQELERGQGLLHQLVYDRQLSRRATEAFEAIQKAGEMVRKLDTALGSASVDGLAGEARGALAETREAAQRINRVLRQVEEGKGVVHALIYDESCVLNELDALVSRAGALVAGVERGEGALGVLVRDPDATRATRRLVAAAEALAKTVEEAREADGLLRALVFAPEGKALVADLQATARHFRQVAERLDAGQGLLGALTRPGTEGVAEQVAGGLAGIGRLADSLAGDARLGEAMEDLRAALGHLRTVMARVEAGDGTVGGLLNDPTVYENLAAFLEGAQRSVLLRALIRSAIGSGTGAK